MKCEFCYVHEAGENDSGYMGTCLFVRWIKTAYTVNFRAHVKHLHIVSQDMSCVYDPTSAIAMNLNIKNAYSCFLWEKC